MPPFPFFVGANVKIYSRPEILGFNLLLEAGTFRVHYNCAQYCLPFSYLSKDIKIEGKNTKIYHLGLSGATPIQKSTMSRADTPNTYNYTPSVLQRLLISGFKGVNKLIPWHKLPTYIGVLNLSAFRYELRQKNLHDVYPSPESQGWPGCPIMHDEQYLHTRHSDGLFNDLQAPKMGCVGMRFGRNVAREHTVKPSSEELMTPNPRVVSEELLKRDVFKPATSLNLLAAAWIQLVLKPIRS